MVDIENLDGKLPVSPESDEWLRLQHIINNENEKPAKETANVLSSWWESDDSLAAYKAAMAELRQAKERLYQNIDELLLSASMVMLNSELTFDERIKKAISKYEKADKLASDLDDELKGKNKHLDVLYAYKKFLQDYELEWKDEILKRVEASILELSEK